MYTQLTIEQALAELISLHGVLIKIKDAPGIEPVLKTLDSAYKALDDMAQDYANYLEERR